MVKILKKKENRHLTFEEELFVRQRTCDIGMVLHLFVHASSKNLPVRQIFGPATQAPQVRTSSIAENRLQVES